MPDLLLFDIDGTLLRVPAGRRAFRAAFLELFEISAIDTAMEFGGRTDTGLFQEALAACGQPPAPHPRLYQIYLKHLRQALSEEPGILLPGVRELLDACRPHGQWRLALGTGNLKEGAFAKLAVHDLDTYFPVGGFGEDSLDRSEILAAGIRRAEDHYQETFRHVIVIGDTPHDINAARDIGALSVAVATGSPSAAVLADAAPTALLSDFSNLNHCLHVFQELGAHTAERPDRR